MISAPFHTRPLLPLLLLALAATPASAAAQLTFGGVPWGTPEDSATAQLRRAGYVLRGEDQDGDQVFWGPDREDVVTTFDSAGLVGAEVQWSGDVGGMPARFERLADSLRDAFGLPEPGAEGEEQTLYWEDDGVRLSLYLHPGTGGIDSLLLLRYEGPGWQAEFDRRDDAAGARREHERVNGRADTTAYGHWLNVDSDGRDFTRVDTVRFTRLGDGLYRARFLDSWMQMRRLENGLKYTGALTEVELDCRRMGTRPLRTIPLYDHRATPAIEGEWWLPPLPNRNHAREVAAACAALGRQP